VEALQTGDAAIAEMVIGRDDKVDALDAEIEADAMRLLALQQPVGRDLRVIGTALKITTDLERIGDHAVDIAKIARKLAQQVFIPSPPVDVQPLTQQTLALLDHSLEALLRHDQELAHQVVIDDDAVDNAFKALRDQLLAAPAVDASKQAATYYMLLVVVYLERIADHATNVAERVHYIETGQMESLSRQYRLAQIQE